MKDTQQPRRRFLQIGTAFITALFAGFPKINQAQAISDNSKGVIVREGEGEHIITGRRKAPLTIKFSQEKNGINNISFLTEDIFPERKIPVHKHLYNDELIFIHKGEGIFTLDEQVTEIKSGTVIFVPRGVWHGLENTGKENIVMVFGYSPAGFEAYFRENGTPAGMPAKVRTAEEYAMTEKKYGMIFK